MDRSFLSRPEVIKASRQFVCVRLATYEDAEEGALLKALVHTRSGELENSVFAILAPDGKEKLVRAARSMRQVFVDAPAMADEMAEIARRFPPRAEPAALPVIASVRLALDVAAADGQPLIVVRHGKDNAAVRRLDERVAAISWSKDFIGRFVYTTASIADELAAIDGVDSQSSVVVVQPDKFGLKGAVLEQISGEVPAEQITEAFRASLAKFGGQRKSMQTHVREGQTQGVFWETKIPVTDPMEKIARERGRRR